MTKLNSLTVNLAVDLIVDLGIKEELYRKLEGSVMLEVYISTEDIRDIFITSRVTKDLLRLNKEVSRFRLVQYMQYNRCKIGFKRLKTLVDKREREVK